MNKGDRNNHAVFLLRSLPDAKDLDQLSRHNITHILSIHESPQPLIPGITYLRIALPDMPEANIKKHFKECIHFIHACRMRGGNCLVHCLAGISRSTTIVLAYAMAVTQLSWHEALEAVKAVRPVANPNLGFRRQLEEYACSRSAEKVRARRGGPRVPGSSPLWIMQVGFLGNQTYLNCCGFL
uniref:Dual specificity protein phosphatase 15 n=1 Tax=Varanus komodoensis TaxID=61221 RepID=A0A8D2L4Q8_VARKO